MIVKLIKEVEITCDDGSVIHYPVGTEFTLQRRMKNVVYKGEDYMVPTSMFEGNSLRGPLFLADDECIKPEDIEGQELEDWVTLKLESGAWFDVPAEYIE